MKRSSVLTTALSNVVIVAAVAVLAVVVGLSTVDTATAFAPIRQGTEANTVALTINVYIGTEYVQALDEILHRYGLPATFFLGGCWVVKHADVAQKLVQNGHCIASHGYSHLAHDTMDYTHNLQEMQKAHRAIQQATGIDVTLFAPPSGAYNQATLKAAQQMDYQVILWSKDTIDWRDQDIDVIVDRACRDKQSGDIILMHPTAATVQALPRIIDSYLSAGYRFVTVDKML